MAVAVRPNLVDNYSLLAADWVQGAGKEAPFLYGRYSLGSDVWIVDSVVYSGQYTQRSVLEDADYGYMSGRTHVVPGAVARMIYDAGFSDWLYTI